MADADAKVIAVTGASRGIGAAIALDLQRRGFVVACLSRSGDLPDGRRSEERLSAMVCDVGDEAAVASTMAKLVRRLGRLDGLVNNAGIHLSGPSRDIALDDLDQVLRTNAVAAVLLAREAYPHLAASGSGRIVNIGSFFDKLGVPNNLAYCASKAAVGAITRCLAVEWARDGIQVVNVAPGYVRTDLNAGFLDSEKVASWIRKRIPVGRPGNADEVARLVGALLAEDIPFLTGETIYLDGGQGMAH